MDTWTDTGGIITLTGTGKDWTWADIHGTDDKRDIGMDKRDGHRLDMMEDG